jgi:hypothetical protein
VRCAHFGSWSSKPVIPATNLCFVLQFDPNPHLLAKLAHADVADGWMATFVFFQKKGLAVP